MNYRIYLKVNNGCFKGEGLLISFLKYWSLSTPLFKCQVTSIQPHQIQKKKKKLSSPYNRIWTFIWFKFYSRIFMMNSKKGLGVRVKLDLVINFQSSKPKISHLFWYRIFFNTIFSKRLCYPQKINISNVYKANCLQRIISKRSQNITNKKNRVFLFIQYVAFKNKDLEFFFFSKSIVTIF